MWHGWTTSANAGAYEQLLRSEVFEAIARRDITGYRGIELLRRRDGDEVAFVTLMWFESLDAIRAFAGPDAEVAVAPPAAQALLARYDARYDARSAHYEVRVPGADAAGLIARPAI